MRVTDLDKKALSEAIKEGQIFWSAKAIRINVKHCRPRWSLSVHKQGIGIRSLVSDNPSQLFRYFLFKLTGLFLISIRDDVDSFDV